MRVNGEEEEEVKGNCVESVRETTALRDIESGIGMVSELHYKEGRKCVCVCACV